MQSITLSCVYLLGFYSLEDTHLHYIVLSSCCLSYRHLLHMSSMSSLKF